MQKYLAVVFALCVLCGSSLSVTPFASRIPAMPSLTFGAATSNRVNCGSAAVLDDLPSAGPMTIIMWVYPATLTAGRSYISKRRGSSNNGFVLYVADADDIGIFADRATTDLEFISNNGPISTNKWIFVATVLNIGSNNADIYVGDLTTAPTEVSYGTTTGGSGAYASEAARSLMIGNVDDTSPALAWQGRIAVTAIWNRSMTLDEIKTHWWKPYCNSGNGCKLFVQLGWAGATASQGDLSGNANSCTGTGTTAADHAPIRR